MAYLFGWFFIYLCGFFQGFTKYKGAFFGVLIILALSVLVVFRGSVGTDTNTYENMIDDFTGVFASVEFGYTSLIFILKNYFSDSVFVLRIVGFFFCIFFLIAYFLSNKDERFLMLFYLAPSFFYTYGMNAIRLGVASLLFYIAVKLFIKRFFFSALIVSVVSLSFHYSIAFSYVVFFVILFNVFNFKLLLLLVFFSFSFYVALYGYLINKLTLYKDFHSAGFFSGLSDVLLIFVFLFIAFLSGLSKENKVKYIVFSLFLCSFSYLLALNSYAGLRFLNLLSFCLPISLILLHSYTNVALNLNARYLILLSGLLSIIFVYRNFLNEPDGLSSFLPYSFIF